VMGGALCQPAPATVPARHLYRSQAWPLHAGDPEPERQDAAGIAVRLGRALSARRASRGGHSLRGLRRFTPTGRGELQRRRRRRPALSLVDNLVWDADFHRNATFSIKGGVSFADARARINVWDAPTSRYSLRPQILWGAARPVAKSASCRLLDNTEKLATPAGFEPATTSLEG